ncbi:MAG: FAD-dependent thymidylate synthase [Candidatus Micrarchaeota archaeon]
MENTSSVRLISVTSGMLEKQKTPEEIITYCARVSNPKNQENTGTAPKLLAFCIRNGHWSIFEMADMCLEIKTSRAIAQQILRHRSFSFQEFSQRYAVATEFITYEARRQDLKNRQNSIDDLPADVQEWFLQAQKKVQEESHGLYEQALQKGIAKECARFLLPLNTQTTLYMKGSARSWIHYIKVRADESTQKEHREIALAAREIFCENFPSIAAALEWRKEEGAQEQKS